MTQSNPRRKPKIHFPSSWNDKWSNEGVTDFERVKTILYDFNSHDDSDKDEKKALWEVLHASEVYGHYRTVSSIATAIKTRVFRNKHSSFGSTWLLHRMQFILLKCLPNIPQNSSTDELCSFFFDISIPIGLPSNTKVLSDGLIALKLPNSMLKVVIIGGGPTGLLAAINLAERVRSRELIQIHVYDKRWMNQKVGEFQFTAYPEYERRRDQVVTLQDHVTELLSPETRDFLNCGLDKRGGERVWPDSSNLQIRKVEDALLRRAQDSTFDGIIHLHGAEVTDEAALLEKTEGDFHLLLGTDGANSWVRRRYFSEEEEPCGRSFALGVALDRGLKRLPRSQALNIFLTLCQTRFLLNASDRDGTGYLNMLLTEEEYDQCVSVVGTPADFRSPAYIYAAGLSGPPPTMKNKIFAPYEENSNLWQSIADGLRLFGFETMDVKNIVRIPINLMGVKTATKMVTFQSKTRPRPHCLVSLAGDSALTHHFWPGRGMNSGMKAAIAWSNQVSDLVLERNGGLVGLEPRALNPFMDFMTELRHREHTQRSFVIQDTSGSPEKMEKILKQSRELLMPDWKVTPKLCKRAVHFAAQLGKRGKPSWPHPETWGLYGKIMKIMCPLSTRTKAEMYCSSPWPTKKMSGHEVHPPKPRIPSPPRSRAGGETCTSQNEPKLDTRTSQNEPKLDICPSQNEPKLWHVITAITDGPPTFSNVVARVLAILLIFILTSLLILILSTLRFILF